MLILWIAFVVLQLTLVIAALAASYNARALVRHGCFGRAETASTLSFCLYVMLGVIFICTVSSALNVVGLALTAVWAFMAWREKRYADGLVVLQPA